MTPKPTTDRLLVGYGVCIGSEARYRRCAAPALARYKGERSPVAESRYTGYDHARGGINDQASFVASNATFCDKWRDLLADSVPAPAALWPSATDTVPLRVPAET